jgi:hypothetical protein
MNLKCAFILLLFFTNFFISSSQTIWTVGPMLHVNFGGKEGEKKVKVSYALEFAYWNFSRFPYSFDFAAEFGKKRIRLYTEAQTGIGIAGISAGPVLEIQTDKSACKLGFQTTVWANYFLGFDYRYRRIDKTNFNCIGTYVKGGFNARDENGEKIESSGSYHHWDD